MYREELALYELLKELDTVCCEAQVNYFLIEHEALCQVRKEWDYSTEFHVCMYKKDFDTIEQKLLEVPEREIEKFESNMNMPGYFVRYINTNTVLYNLNYHKVRSGHGAAINIHFLKADNESARKLTEFESLMEQEIDGLPNADVEKLALIQKLKKNRIKFKKTIEKLSKRAFAVNDQANTYLKVPGKEEMEFPNGFWEKPVRRAFQGGRFLSMKDMVSYLEIAYGCEWEAMELDNKKNLYMVFSDMRIPYRTFISRMEESKEYDDYFWNRRRTYLKNMEEDFHDRVEEQNKNWNILSATEARLQLWKQYMPLKDNIMQLWKQERMDEVELILCDYDVKAKEMLEKEFAICFDSDIWEMYLTILKNRGQESMAEKLEALLDPQNLQPIQYEEMKAYLHKMKENKNYNIVMRGL